MKICYNKGMKDIKFRQSLFWDTDPKKIDKKKNARYIIERILDHGNDREVKWLYYFYNKKLLKNIVLKSRGLMPETKNLWKTILKEK